MLCGTQVRQVFLQPTPVDISLYALEGSDCGENIFLYQDLNYIMTRWSLPI